MKARDRLSTIQAKDIRFQLQQKKKKRKTSLKRRPTFYRTTAAVEDKATAPNEIEVDIGADVVTTTTSATTVESSRSSSMSSKVWVFLHKKQEPYCINTVAIWPIYSNVFMSSLCLQFAAREILILSRFPIREKIEALSSSSENYLYT